MRCSRFLVALTATSMLVVSVGCGGGGNKDARSMADKSAIDVSLVTPDDFAAIVLYPRRIAQSPLLAEQLKDQAIAEAIKKFGIDPGEVEQIVVLLSVDEKHPKNRESIPVLITRFTHDVDAKEVLNKWQAAMAPRGPLPITEIQVGGKTCLDLGAGDAPLAYVPSRNTIVLTTRENMEKVVNVTELKGPLWERLQKAPADNEMIIAVESAALPDFDKIIDAAKDGATPPLVTYLEAAKKLRGGTATVNLTAPALLRLVLDAKDAEAAGNVEELLQQGVRMARGGLDLAKQAMPKELQSTFGPLLKLADQLADGATAAKSGSEVVLDVKRPESLDTAGSSIASAIRKYVMKARADARRVQQINNMKQVILAMLNYEATFRTFPPAVIEKDGKPLLSWRVHILRFMDEDALFRQFHLDEPWDSPHNLEAAKTIPFAFQSPDDPSDGKTRIMLFTGKGAAFDGGKKIRMMDIRDATSNTILCVEAGPDKAVPWTKPEDLPFDPENPLAALGAVPPQGFLAAFFDGSVRQLKVDNKTLKALITPDGGEAIDQAKLYGGR